MKHVTFPVNGIRIVLILFFCWLILPTGGFAQDPRPELMYFRFDEPGQPVTPNRANPATAVTPQGTLIGAQTMGQVGQFGSALIGTGSGTGSDYVHTGWSTNLGTNSWTLSFWINNVGGSTFGYYWGDASAGSFRCFNAGAAGNNNLTMRGPFSNVDVTGVAPGPTVVHFVRDSPGGTIKAYKNGVLVNTVAVGSSIAINGSGGQFWIGAYSGGGGTGSMPANALLDEFRLYNRALSAQEIADTWNRDVDCFFPEGTMKYELLDGNLQPTTFVQVPGILNLKYTVTFPTGAANVGITLNLRNVITDAIVFTHSFTASKQAGQPLNGIETIPIPPNVPSGYMRAEVIFNNMNSCDVYTDYIAESSTLLLLPPGAQMCIVWPGDVDNNNLVNYTDRAALNRYIYDANLRSSWLQGPTRFSVTGGLDYIAWKAQPAAPWQTPEGCYMDTDGNGVINNFDYIAIKLNWLRTHGGTPPKQSVGFSALSFDMDQNYPNPFNPATSIRYAVPEPSQVRLVVTDMLGREIATLVDGRIEAGVHIAEFNASKLGSGNYIATVSMTGIESGLTFSKSMRMTMNK